MRQNKFTKPSALCGVLLALAVIGGGIGCGAGGYPIGTENARPMVLSDATRDLDCPADDIRLEEGFGGVWDAIGCGRKATYKANCDSIRCEVRGENEGPVLFRDRPEDVPR